MPREKLEYVPLETLSEEERTKADLLEEKTDSVYGLRTQLASFYRDYRRYLPEREEDGRKRRMRIEDIARAVRAGQKLEELIPWQNVDGEVESLPKPASEKERMKKWRHVQVAGAFRRALRAESELRSQGGAWREGNLSEENKEAQDYYKMRWGEFGKAAHEFDTLRSRAEELEDLKDIAHSDSEFYPHPEDIDELERQYKTIFDEAKKLTLESPEAYLFTLGRQLKETKELFDTQGRIVETSYVKAKLARLKELLGQSRPVFIHGELGTGKTELAKHLARKELSRQHILRWEANNPPPASSKERKKLEERRAEEAEAIVISGYRGIEIEQILATRAIERKAPPTPEEQVKIIESAWKEFSEQQQETSSKELKELKKIHTEAYQEAFRSPVETKVILGPLLEAMRAGRPLIIDEMNAIPHHVLIVMNDLLMRRPGDLVRAPFPGEEPFRIQEGFSVIATGNYKPEDGLMYPGRQPLDAAFLSRFGIVSYDYLPMERITEAPGLSPEEQREFRMRNELYQMIVTRLLSRDLSATIPEGSFEKLEKLAVLARNLEDIFAGHEVTRGWYAKVGNKEVRPQDVLKENVLSIRHLLPILDAWKADGFRRDLDEYLFLDYVSRSDARPAEKLYLYRILKVQGDFFPDTKAWPSLTETDKVLTYPIEQKMYQVDARTGLRAPLPDRSITTKTFSPKEVIERLYGPAPKRKVLPKQFIERKKETTAPGENDLDLLERERLIEKLREAMKKLDESGYET